MTTPNPKLPKTTAGLIGFWLSGLPEVYVGVTGTLPSWCRVWILIDAIIFTLVVISQAARVSRP